MGHGVGGPEEAAWQGVFPGSLLGVNSALDSVTSGPARHRAAATREAGSTVMRLGSRRGPCPLICPHPSRLPKHAREAGGGAAVLRDPGHGHTRGRRACGALHAQKRLRWGAPERDRPLVPNQPVCRHVSSCFQWLKERTPFLKKL